MFILYTIYIYILYNRGPKDQGTKGTEKKREQKKKKKGSEKIRPPIITTHEPSRKSTARRPAAINSIQTPTAVNDIPAELRKHHASRPSTSQNGTMLKAY